MTLDLYSKHRSSGFLQEEYGWNKKIKGNLVSKIKFSV